MVSTNKMVCPVCESRLKYFDSVERLVRTKKRKTIRIKVRRLKCVNCGHIHREIPNYILPYKQYETEIIQGVIEGFITSDTLGYEDYPCETTMIRWKTQNIQFVL